MIEKHCESLKMMCRDGPGDGDVNVDRAIKTLSNSQAFHQDTDISIYVTSLHVIRHALLTTTGYIVTGEVSIYHGACDAAPAPESSTRHDILTDKMVTYEEVLAVRGVGCDVDDHDLKYGYNTYKAKDADDKVLDICSNHMSIPLYYAMEVAPYLSYLGSHNGRNVHIHVPHISYVDLRSLTILLKAMNITNKIVWGPTKAHTLYTPVPSTHTKLYCFDMFQAQLLAETLVSVGLNYNTSKVYPTGLIRNSLLLLKQNGMEYFDDIHAMMTKLAAIYNLTMEVIDEEKATTRDILVKFYSAILVVGTHGPLMNYIYAGLPGMYVLEGRASGEQHCYQRLATMLGQHYHGIEAADGNVKAMKPSAFEMSIRFYLWAMKEAGQLKYPVTGR